MSKDIYLDPITNDISITNSLFRLSDPQQETTRQKANIYLSLFRGEVFWSIGSGIPWLANDNNPTQLLSKQTTDKRFIDTYIREAIQSREGVVEITDYQSSLDVRERTMSVSFEAITESGETIIVEDLEINVGG